MFVTSNDLDSASQEVSIVGRCVIIRGVFRIECLARQVVRLELARENGTFCDERTFSVACRDFDEVVPAVEYADHWLTITMEHYQVKLDGTAQTSQALLKSIVIINPQSSAVLWRAADGLPGAYRFPRSEQPGVAWAFADAPRAVVPPWGAAPAPPEILQSLPQDLAASNGWQIESDARDYYVFLHGGDLEKLRHDFLQLTGSIPLLPRWALGLWNSRYYPYSEEAALATLDRFRAEGLGIDAFVIDTDWRMGASRGYDINTELFPDMGRFLRAMHERHAHVLFNDHPEPLHGWSPTDPRLLRYRDENLTRLLNLGLSSWWFDRNWTDIIPGPAEGIETAIWGQAVYHDIMQRFAPERRTMLLSMWSEHVAAHRYPVWWTGDIQSDWETLQEGVRETLAAGDRLLPWTHQDLGGHIGFPSPEQYTRWIEWGAFAPIMRLHCGPHDRCRDPWAFGTEVLAIVRDYVALRYRLLPMFYAAAHRATMDGTAPLRRLSHVWPQFSAAGADDQFLLGEDLLVAPILCSSNEGDWHNLSLVLPNGFKLEAFADRAMQEPPLATQIVDEVRLNPLFHSQRVMAWGAQHSLRWSGAFRPDADGDYKFFLTGNGRKGLWIGESNAIIEGFDKGNNAVTLRLKAGTDYPLRIHYHLDGHGMAECRLSMTRLADFSALQATSRQVWLPPGEWHDLWSGTLYQGPKSIETTAVPRQTPLFARGGAIIPLAPAMLHTGEKSWDPLTLEMFIPSQDIHVTRELYEDDGESTRYREGARRVTPLVLQRQSSCVSLEVGPGQGEYPGFLPSRTWRLRLHLPSPQLPRELQLNGETLPLQYSDAPLSVGWVNVLASAVTSAVFTMPLAGSGAPAPEAPGPVLETLVTGDAFLLTMDMTH